MAEAGALAGRFGVGGSGTAIGGCSSMVEPQPSKLMAWVRFPPPAPAIVAKVAMVVVVEALAHVAQSVEHVLGKDEVTGSIPVVGSTRPEAVL